MSVVWLNGSLLDESEARLQITDRGFTLADGVFETIRAVGAKPLWLPGHLQRLKAGADQIGLSIPFKEDVIENAIAQLLDSASSATSAIRLTVTRGPVAARGLWPSKQAFCPTCVLTIAPASAPSAQDFVICKITRRNEYSPLSRIKSLNYGDNILARQEAHERNAGDALMLNTAGNIACATVGNAFFLIAGRWKTSSLTDGILAGLARRRFIKELDAVETPLSVKAIMTSEMAFVCNSLGATPIRSIEGHALPAEFKASSMSSIYSL
jgi:branched-chain amino acid aminotransferase